LDSGCEGSEGRGRKVDVLELHFDGWCLWKNDGGWREERDIKYEGWRKTGQFGVLG